MTRLEALRIAIRELLNGTLPISVIEELQEHGWSPLEAEEIVETAEFDLENEHE